MQAILSDALMFAIAFAISFYPRFILAEETMKTIVIRYAFVNKASKCYNSITASYLYAFLRGNNLIDRKRDPLLFSFDEQKPKMIMIVFYYFSGDLSNGMK